MISFFNTYAYRLLGAVLLLTSVVGHGQSRPASVAGKVVAAAAHTGMAVLTGRVSGVTTDSVAVSLRENPLDPKEKLFRVPLNDKGDFKIVVPLNGPTKADLVYGDDVAPLFLDPGTDMDLR